MRRKTERKHIERVNPNPELGLTARQVQERIAAGWKNISPQSASRTEGEIIVANCLTFFNLVFGVLAAILILVGSNVKNLTFLVVVIINTVIGCVQEIRAKRAVDALTLVARQRLKVIRDGKEISLPDSELVIDDVTVFSTGDQICADGILRTGALWVNEALITGEADLIEKRPGAEVKSGSFVVAGTGRAQLTAVGEDAFAARLALAAKADPRAAKSEMMASLDKLIRFAAVALVPIGLILFYQAFRVLGLSLRESVEDTVPALVGMIPEGLYLLTSIAVAASAIKLSKSSVLVQDLNCMETLARVDVLCVDKTGTITENAMAVEQTVSLEDSEYVHQVLRAYYAGENGENETARAMQAHFSGATDWEVVRSIPFTSQSKWSAKVFREQGTFVVGAPDVLLGSRYEALREDIQPLQTGRVLLVARYMGQLEELDLGLVRPLALVVLSNRIRPEAEETFAYFASQGVAIKVISGDNPVTVSQVAIRAGIAGAENYLDAGALQREEDYLQAVDTYTVFGRVTPDQKQKLVAALKQKGHTVAMVGDGVNDVLAMKESDCGIAMASGAQAASQIARLVLLKSDFSAMPRILGEGRRVINNIQRAASLFLVKNIFSLGMALLALILGWEYPVEAFHLTVVSALTIGVPSFFLALEPNYERISGHFLPNVLSKALPGGLTNIVMILAAAICAQVLGMDSLAPVCAGLLGMVGMVVLFQTSVPFGRFRALVFGAMGIALVGCFIVLPRLFDLTLTKSDLPVFGVLLAATPAVYVFIRFLWKETVKMVAFFRKNRYN